MFTIFMYCFLGIFMATAALTLASLPGWINLPDRYKARLFTTLILEVVGCVTGFVWVGIRLNPQAQAPSLSASQLATTDKWYWQYSPRNLMTEAKFGSSQDGSLNFVATTFFRQVLADKSTDTPIIEWRSLEPINLKGGGPLTFACEKVVRPEYRQIDATSQMPGTYRTTITLQPKIVLSGGYAPAPKELGGYDQSIGGMMFSDRQ